MAVAIKVSAEGSRTKAHTGRDCDVGIQARVDVAFTLGACQPLIKGLPVGSTADREIVGFQLVPCTQGRGTTVHKHFNLIVHTGAREADHLVAIITFVGSKHIDGSIHGFFLSVDRCHTQLHLRTFVPYGIVLIAILPPYTHSVGSLIFPFSGIVGNGQQVYIIDYARSRGRGRVAVPSPCLGSSTTNTVGQMLQRATTRQMSFSNGIHEGAVYIGIVLLVKRELYRSDSGKITLLTCQRTLHLKEVNIHQVV